MMSVSASRGTSIRLSAFYAAFFLVNGIQMPFWPVRLTGRGFGAEEIGLLFAAAIWVKVFATPMIGALADRLGQRRGCMIALAGVTMVGLGALWNAYGFWALLFLALVAEVAQSAMMPLADSITLASVRRDGLDYGRVRLWGSVSFIFAAIASGAFLGHTATAGLGGNTVLALVLGAAAVLFFACVAVPTPSAEPAGQSRWAALGALAGDRRF